MTRVRLFLGPFARPSTSKPEDHLQKAVVVDAEVADVFAVEFERLGYPDAFGFVECVLEREKHPVVVVVGRIG